MAVTFLGHKNWLVIDGYISFVGTELKDLINELQGVTDWFLLGLCLGVPESKLEEIKQDHRLNNDRRKAVLTTWKHAEIETTWVKLVNALLEMGAHVHALYIAAKHGNILSCRNKGEPGNHLYPGYRLKVSKMSRTIKLCVDHMHAVLLDCNHKFITLYKLIDSSLSTLFLD